MDASRFLRRLSLPAAATKQITTAVVVDRVPIESIQDTHNVVSAGAKTDSFSSLVHTLELYAPSPDQFVFTGYATPSAEVSTDHNPSTSTGRALQNHENDRSAHARSAWSPDQHVAR
ncbi:hypothetical protein EVJ58_g10115 [Rhodofomes roseus]|uniref:Uncharacterized protein n=1 Tax=Rhodofomes roseus TaxID=34475 RepID=A0A4Y9XQ95_9APHY|nr:hypothetical protein EVJ58_g10115 [Rhodofomes roseus]